MVPLVLGKQRLRLDPVTHAHCRVLLAIDKPRHRSDRQLRDDLANEDNATPPSIRLLATHIKAEVHLLEVPISRNRNADHPRIEEHEADHADEGPPLPVVELRTIGHQVAEQPRIDCIVEHHQMSPIGSQEGAIIA